VSRRRVLEAVFILLEFPSPSRRIFIGSHSLPPSLVRRIGPSQTLLNQVTCHAYHSNMAFGCHYAKSLTIPYSVGYMLWWVHDKIPFCEYLQDARAH
jgi:hypothetical protein